MDFWRNRFVQNTYAMQDLHSLGYVTTVKTQAPEPVVTASPVKPERLCVFREFERKRWHCLACRTVIQSESQPVQTCSGRQRKPCNCGKKRRPDGA
jgi:hypothetical protein